MRKILLLIIFIFTILNGFTLDNKNYLLKYHYLNYAVSPDMGFKRYEVILYNNKAKEVLDLKNGKIISSNEAFGLEDAINYLKGKKVKNNFYTIKIDFIKKISNSFHLNPLVERYKELRENYIKWKNLNINSYIIRVEDSRFKNLYEEGIELVIKNSNIIKAKDVRTNQEIEVNKNFFTLEKLFGVVKWGIKDAIIDYDIKYYFPNLIIIPDKISIKIDYFKILR